MKKQSRKHLHAGNESDTVHLESHVKYSFIPKGGDVGFPNAVIQTDPCEAPFTHFHLPHTTVRFVCSDASLRVYVVHRPCIYCSLKVLKMNYDACRFKRFG